MGLRFSPKGLRFGPRGFPFISGGLRFSPGGLRFSPRVFLVHGVLGLRSSFLGFRFRNTPIFDSKEKCEKNALPNLSRWLTTSSRVKTGSNDSCRYFVFIQRLRQGNG